MAVPTGTPYGPQPRWDGSNAAPFSQSSNVGYDVVAARFPEKRRLNDFTSSSTGRGGGENATINDGDYQWPMYVHDVSIDFALNGTRAQARTTRDFYPHNFTQPGFVVQGQALDQQDYGSLCEFMHQAQHKALSGGNLIQLWVKGYGIDGGRTSHAGVTKNGTFYPNQIVRGSHQTLLCQGYVGSMPRQHQKFTPAPVYTFTFIVANMIQGPYQEDIVQVQKQATWIDVLKQGSNITSTPALIKENQGNLKWVAQNSQNIITNSTSSGG